MFTRVKKNRQTQKGTYRQTDEKRKALIYNKSKRQTDRQRYNEMQKVTHKQKKITQTVLHTNNHTNIQTNTQRQTHRRTHTKIFQQTDIQVNKHIDKQTKACAILKVRSKSSGQNSKLLLCNLIPL
jgi:hypothetical protein